MVSTSKMSKCSIENEGPTQTSWSGITKQLSSESEDKKYNIVSEAVPA